jgi:hypothetical protein
MNYFLRSSARTLGNFPKKSRLRYDEPFLPAIMLGSMIPMFGLVVIALATGACQANRGQDASSEIPTASRRAGVTGSPASGNTQDKSDEPIIEPDGAATVLTFRKCRVRLDPVDATHAKVSAGQTCSIVLDGYNTKLAIKGTVTFESADTFYAEITGTPTEPGVEGEYVWKFQGTRKS